MSRAYFGNHPALVVQPYELEGVAERGLYVGLGIACGTVAAIFMWVMGRFETLAPRVPIPKVWRPVANEVVLGLLILAVANLYGVGYATMDGALSERWEWTLLAVLLVAKIAATSLTLASGGTGGMFLP